MVDAEIRVTGGDQVRAGASLWVRLDSDDGLRRQVERRSRPMGENELGTALDFFSIALGSSGVGVALFKALTVWIQTQRSDVEVTATVNGRTVELRANNLKDARPILRDVLGLPPEDEVPEDSEER